MDRGRRGQRHRRPRSRRGIWPITATITAEGYQRVPDAELAERFAALLDDDDAARSTAAPAGGSLGGAAR